MKESQPLSEEFVRLALAIEEHVPGYLDAYFGPDEWMQEAKQAGKLPLTELAERTDRLTREDDRVNDWDMQRKDFLAAQLRAMQMSLRMLSGEKVSLMEEVQALYDVQPEWKDESIFIEAYKRLEELLPAGGSLKERLERWNTSLRLPLEKIKELLPVIADRLRDCTRQKFDLPVVSQSFGTVPDSAWKARKYKENRRIVERPDWTASDTLNASIGQGFLILNPLQLAVMAARIASGRNVQPQLIGVHKQPAPLLGLEPEHLEAVRGGMWEVVNGDGTAGATRLQIPGIEMCGKTGTAQVRKIVGSQRGQSGDWKYRDHGLFVFFAPFDNPRYAGSVVIEHGLGGARAAAPVAKDVLTYLFDRPQAMKRLAELETQWGGTLLERTERRQAQFDAVSKANAGLAA